MIEEGKVVPASEAIQELRGRKTPRAMPFELALGIRERRKTYFKPDRVIDRVHDKRA